MDSENVWSVVEEEIKPEDRVDKPLKNGKQPKIQTKKYYWILRPGFRAIITPPEIFARAPTITKLLPTTPGAANYAKGGVLIPVAKWNKYRLYPFDTGKPSWAIGIEPVVLDARDLQGNTVAAIVQPVGRDKPKPEDWDAWFRAGQSHGMLDTSVVNLWWTETAFQCRDAQGRNNNRAFVGNVQLAKGYTRKISPVDALYPTSKKYIKLRKADYLLIGASGRNAPDAVFISMPAMELLLAGEYTWPQGSTKMLDVRTETGSLTWIQCAPGTDVTSRSNWVTWERRATSKIETEGAWSRHIDPELKLYIWPHSSRINPDELKKIFTTVFEKKTTKQTFQMLQNCPSTDYKFLSISPFDDYSTYIEEEEWDSYLTSRPDRELPLGEATIKGANKKISGNLDYKTAGLTVFRPPVTITSPVNAEKIRSARGTRREAMTQMDVMGGTATDIAREFGWQDAEKRITKATPKWPGTGNMPAEWLHRSAYSWGGLTSSSQYDSSQVPANLIFGSSECNSIMTRYEKAWQNLFLKESKLQKTVLGIKELHGWLETNIRFNFTYMNFLAQSHYMLHNQNEIKKGTKENEMWLCYCMSYSLTLSHASAILGAGNLLFTAFYPFERGFFTRMESAVDELLLNFLEARLVNISHPNLIEYHWVHEIQGTSPHNSSHFNTVPTILQHSSLGWFDAVSAEGGSQKLAANSGFTARTSRSSNAGHGSLALELASPNQPHQTDTAIQELKLKTTTAHRRPFQLTPLARLFSHGTSVESGVQVRAAGQGVVEHSSYTAPTSALDRLWSTVVRGTDQIELDGMTLFNPRLVTADEQKNELDVLRGMVGIDQNGQAVSRSGNMGRDTIVTDPTATAPISPTSASQVPATPAHFVIKGDITLFGIVHATLCTVQDPSTAGVTERVELISNISLGRLMPELKGIPLDTINLEKTSFTYHSAFHRSSPPGLRFQTDVFLTGPLLQPVNDALSEVFRQEQPSLTFSAYVGYERNWTKPMPPTAFTLQAALVKLETDPSDIININDIGINLMINRQITRGADGIKSEHTFSYGFWGVGGVRVPGSLVPIPVNWYMMKMDNYYNMTLNVQDAWTDVLGIRNLNLRNVQFDTSFTSGSFKDSLQLRIQANLDLRSQTMTLMGSYSKDDWSIEGALHNVTLTLLEEMYEDMFGESLSDVSGHHDIVFTTLRLRIGTGALSFEGSVTLNGHNATSATITLSSVGLEIKGSVGNVVLDKVIPGKEVTVENAKMNVFIGPAGLTGRPYRVSLDGTVNVGDLAFSVGIYFNKIPDQKSMVTVYGTLDKASLVLSEIAPALKGTFLDLELTNVALVASNEGQPSGQVPNKFKYPVIKGFQICATIAKLNAVNGMTRTTPKTELVLCVVYSKDSLEVDITWPTPGTITFNRNIKSGPITLKMAISESPKISITAALLVTVPHQPDPLVLQFVVDAGELTASGSASMVGMWNNPLNISPSVSIGNLLFEVTVLYEEFFESGIPEKIEFGGDIYVGDCEASLLIDVTENPEEELISASITNLDFANLVNFASRVAQEPIPTPQLNDILKFNKFDFYLSSGVTVNNKVYPAGVQFDSDMEVFGHHASITATIGQTTSIKGNLDSFKIGGLTVSGDKDKNPSMAIEIGGATQKFYIDGAIDFVDITASAHIDIAMGGAKPVFSFNADLEFGPGDLLHFRLDAEMLGQLNGADTAGLDFTLTAIFEQHLLDYIIAEANTFFLALNKAAQAGFATAQAVIEKSEAQFKQELANAERQVDLDRKAWEAERDAVNKAFNDKKVTVDADGEKLRNELKDAKGKFDAALKALENKLEQVKLDVAGKIRTADIAIEVKAKEAENTLEKLRKTVGDRENALNVDFGDVNKSLDAAYANVERAQESVNNINTEIGHKKQELSNAGWFERMKLHLEMVGLEIEKGTVDAALWVAEAALKGAQEIIDKGIYKPAKELLDEAQAALAASEKVIAAEAKGLEEALALAQKLGDVALAGAEYELKEAQTSGLAHNIFAEAAKAVDIYVAGIHGLLSEVQAGVDGLEKCTSFLAFTLSEKLLDVIQTNVQNLDPARLALKVAEGGEELIGDVVKSVLEAAENLLEIRSVTIAGQLSLMLSGKQPLVATIVLVLAKKEIAPFSLDFTLGKTSSFLESLWDVLRDEIKKL